MKTKVQSPKSKVQSLLALTLGLGLWTLDSHGAITGVPGTGGSGGGGGSGLTFAQSSNLVNNILNTSNKQWIASQSGKGTNTSIYTTLTVIGQLQMETNGGAVGPYIEWVNVAANYDWIFAPDIATGDFYLRNNNGPTDLIEFTTADRVAFPTLPGSGGFLGMDATGHLLKTNASSSGEANVNGEAGQTNATHFGLVNGKVGVTNLLRSISPGNGLFGTNEGGTNISLAIDPSIVNAATNNAGFGQVNTSQFSTNSNTLTIKNNALLTNSVFYTDGSSPFVSQTNFGVMVIAGTNVNNANKLYVIGRNSGLGAGLICNYVVPNTTVSLATDNSQLFSFGDNPATAQPSFAVHVTTNVYVINHTTASLMNNEATPKPFVANKSESYVLLGNAYERITNMARITYAQSNLIVNGLDGSPATPQAKVDISGVANSYLLRVNTNTLSVSNGNVMIGAVDNGSLARLQVQGSATIATNLIASNSVTTLSLTNTGVAIFGGDSVLVDSGGLLRLFNGSVLGWSSSGAASGSRDTTIGRFGVNSNYLGTASTTTNSTGSLLLSNLTASGVIAAGSLGATVPGPGGFASYATNATVTVGTTGVTNTLNVNAIVAEFAGVSVTQTHADGTTVSRGTISAGIDIILQPGAKLTGTSCSAAANLRAF